MLNPREINTELVTQRIAKALRKHVGRGKEYSYKEFSELTGFDQRSVEGWCRAEKAPYACKLLQCAAILPASFINSILEIAGLEGAYEADGGCNSQQINAKASRLVALICKHMEDGRIDHNELIEQVPYVRELHADLGRFLKEHGG